MKNKVLTEIYIPSIDERYNIYLPLNKNHYLVHTNRHVLVQLLQQIPLWLPILQV